MLQEWVTAVSPRKYAGSFLHEWGHKAALIWDALLGRNLQEIIPSAMKIVRTDERLWYVKSNNTVQRFCTTWWGNEDQIWRQKTSTKYLGHNITSMVCYHCGELCQLNTDKSVWEKHLHKRRRSATSTNNYLLHSHCLRSNLSCFTTVQEKTADSKIMLHATNSRKCWKEIFWHL